MQLTGFDLVRTRTSKLRTHTPDDAERANKRLAKVPDPRLITLLTACRRLHSHWRIPFTQLLVDATRVMRSYPVEDELSAGALQS